MSYPFQLPDLGYDYDALEPSIDARTMEIHYSKHHAGYTKKLNAALEGHAELQNKSIEELLAGVDALPADVKTAVRNNGGGYANHSLFWKIMAPGGSSEPTGELASGIDELCGSFDAFKEEFASTAGGQFGSGWGWLKISNDGNLKIASTPNQDSPLLAGYTPILGVDVWEHAYYLKYQNKRPDYISAWWSVVNWDAVAEQFSAARQLAATG